jgi:hypothetical protein
MMPYDEYVLLDTKLDALLEGHRRRQERAEEKAKKEAVPKKQIEEEKIRDIQDWILRRYYRSAYEHAFSGKRALNDASFIRFLKAVQYLDDDSETHQKYFGDATCGWHVESHPPLFGPKNKRGEITILTPKKILSSTNYSDDLKEAVRDKAFDRKTGGHVVCVIDPECEKSDAARHITGLKRNVITVPQTHEALKAWILRHDRRYQKALQPTGKDADYEAWYERKLRLEDARLKKRSSDRQNGATLDTFFEKDAAATE